MPDQPETCTKCGQPKRQTMDASFTQWIFGNRSCSCDIPSQGEERQICPTCGKFVVAERKGSLTQWIMGPSLCRCGTERSPGNGGKELSTRSNVPSHMVDSSESKLAPREQASSSGGRAPSSDEQILPEQELPLDPEKFPMQRYKPIAELGKGASGAVYLCRDRLLSKKVAVKTLHAFTGRQLISFQTEARAIANLKHPNIVELLDFGPTDSGIPYMVLEYFDGISLKYLIEKTGAQKVDLVIDILTNLAEGLAAAHSKGIYHRDVSASNVLIQFERNDETLAKLIDFGVASIKHEEEEASATSRNTIAGTPAYMSPDVVAGNSYDQRSEIYSLGCVAFEALTGSVPFSGASALETMNMHAKTPAPTLRSINGSANGTEFSEELEQLISKCLEKDPNRRYQSMNEFASALERVRDINTDDAAIGTSNDARSKASISSFPKIKDPASPSRKVTLPFVVIGLTVLGLLAAISFNTVPGIIKYAEESSTANLIKYADQRSKSDPFESTDIKINEADPYSHAFEAYRQAAERGDKDAFKKLGRMYEHGRGVEQNYAEAMRWYRAAVKANDLSANKNLGDLYYGGHGVPVNYPMALQLYHKAAAADDLSACNMVGLMYEKGTAGAKDYATAISWYNRAALRGHAPSMFDAGRMYNNGTGVKKRDGAKAIKMFKLAAAEGHADSEVMLGNIYFDGRGVKRDFKVASEYYQLAADQGDASGQDRIAYMNEMGYGVPKDYASAMEWYRKSAAQGEAKAMNSIGRLFDWGRGVKKDLPRAMKWYQQAAEKGNLDAMNTLAHIYGEGRDGFLDYDKAMMWLRKAAEHGSHEAELSLGALLVEEGPLKDYKESMKWYQRAAPYRAEAYRGMGYLYERGLGVPQNFEEARRYYEAGTKRGDTRSIVSIGCLYEWGYGVKKDFSEAMRYYRLAADKGDVYGTYCVGYLYENGLGVARDYKEAMNWYQQAAVKHEPNAQFEMGILYERGLGVEKDYEKALKCYGLSAAQGNSYGKYHLAYMYENGLGVEKDYIKARELYQEGARKGLGDSSYRLSKMFENGLGMPIDKDKAEMLLRQAAADHSVDAIRELKTRSRN